MSVFDVYGHQPLSERAFLPALNHYLGLEEASKTQIGTFERLYEAIYQTEVGKPMAFGYNDVDFSPLVNPLGAAIEMELSASVYKALYPHLTKVLSQMSEHERNEARLPEPDRCTIGNLLFFLDDDRFGCEQFMRDSLGISDTRSFLNHLKPIHAGRNDSAHRNAMTKDEFLLFYQHFHEFYNTFMPAMIRLKLSV